MTPNRIIDELSIFSISAVGTEGSFTILPEHIDLLSVLRRSIITAKQKSGQTAVYAADDGILTKQGETIRVSSPLIVKGREVSTEDPEKGIAESIDEAFSRLEEKSDNSRKSAFKLETDIVRKMIELRRDL